MFKFICKNNLIFEQIIVICNLLIEFHIFGIWGIKLSVHIFHLFFCIFSPVSIHVQNSSQSRDKYLFNPSSKHFKIFNFSIVEFCEFECCPFEGFVDKMFFIFFMEIEFAYGFVEWGVEAEGVFKIFDEILDELFGVLDFIFEESF